MFELALLSFQLASLLMKLIKCSHMLTICLNENIVMLLMLFKTKCKVPVMAKGLHVIRLLRNTVGSFIPSLLSHSGFLAFPRTHWVTSDVKVLSMCYSFFLESVSPRFPFGSILQMSQVYAQMLVPHKHLTDHYCQNITKTTICKLLNLLDFFPTFHYNHFKE